MFSNAVAGSAKNMTPNRETTRSNGEPGAATSKSTVCASAVTTVAVGTRRRAASTIAGEMSTPTVAAGTAIALPCVWMLGRLLESQLFEVKPTDPVTIGMAAVVLCSTALGAALIPARRASAIHPMDALRFE